MVGQSGNILDNTQQRQLNALKTTARAVDNVTKKLATGKSVSSAIDNPQNFFASQALEFRASRIAKILDDIGQSIRAVQVAENGIENSINILNQAEAYLIDIEDKFRADEIELVSTPNTAVPPNVTQIRPTGPGDFTSYAGSQDSGGPVVVANGGEDITLTGNLWKRLNINYTVTAQTVLEFQYRSTNIPEIAAIGFDNDTSFTNSNDQFFLYGTQFGGIAYSAPIPTYQYDGSGDFVNVEIPIGTFFTGTFSHLTFINDDDIVPTGESEYRNIFLREGPAQVLPDGLTVDPVYQEGYELILDQLDALVEDTDYRGISLLSGENLETGFNEDRSNTLVTEGLDGTSSGLGLIRDDFTNISAIQEKIEQVREARETLRRYAGTLSSDLNIIKTRLSFSEKTINTLRSGGDDLTVADQNKVGAELLALQTRQQIQFTTLGIREPSILDVL